MHHLWNMDFPWCGNCWHFSLPVALIWICKFFQMSSCEWRACDPDSFCVARQKMRNMSSVHVQDTHLQIARLSHTLIQGMCPANRNKLMIMIILSIYIHIPALPRWAEGTHTHTHTHIKSQTHRLFVLKMCFLSFGVVIREWLFCSHCISLLISQWASLIIPASLTTLMWSLLPHHLSTLSNCTALLFFKLLTVSLNLAP